MNKIRIGLLIAALSAFPASVQAQGADKGADKSGEDAGAKPAKEDDLGDLGDLGELEGEEGDKKGDKKGGGLSGGVCELDPEACKGQEPLEKVAKKPLPEQLYAVQQIYSLRVRRVEVNPYWAFTLNDQFVSHPAFGLNINYWITNVLAVGLNGNFYRPFNVDSSFNADVRRAARVGVPLTEYDWSAALNVTYVPAYGKFAGFSDFIFQYDLYLGGGVGAISTRPIPVIDPDNRTFEYEPKVAFNAGAGLRIYFNRWFAAMLEVRDYIYPERLESLEEAPTVEEAQDESTWFQDGASITNNVQAQLGVSIFIPFSFDYRLPK